MAAVLTRGKKIGNVLKKELWADAGWCRKTIEVTVTAAMQVGTVLELTTSAVLGTEVVTATAANAVCILIDERIYDYDAADTPELVVLYAGPSIVAKNALAYGVITSGAETTAEAALTALGMKVEDSVL
jgi:hypothetical protein